MSPEHCCLDANWCDKSGHHIRCRRYATGVLHDTGGNRRNRITSTERIEDGSQRLFHRRDKESPHPSALLICDISLAFVIVAIIGACHLVRGVWNMGLYLLGLGSLLILAMLLCIIIMFMVEPAGNIRFPVIGRGKWSLDLLAGRGLTLACGVLSLAAGAFFIAGGQVPYYLGDSELRMQMILLGGVSLSVGPLAFIGYALQFVRRYFALSLVCTTAVALSAFWSIGILGAIIGVSAIFFVAISKDEFLN